MVRHLADEVAVLQKGKIVEYGSTKTVLGNPSSTHDEIIALQGKISSDRLDHQVSTYSNRIKFGDIIVDKNTTLRTLIQIIIESKASTASTAYSATFDRMVKLNSSQPNAPQRTPDSDSDSDSETDSYLEPLQNNLERLLLKQAFKLAAIPSANSFFFINGVAAIAQVMENFKETYNI